MAPKGQKAALATQNTDYGSMSFSDLTGMIDSGQVAHIQDVDDLVRVEKEALLNQPFVIVDWSFNSDGDFGEYVIVKLVTKDDRHNFFADGSTGIKDQLLAYENKMGGRKPIYLPKGLRVSNYTYTDPADGKEKPAATFYLNNED